MARHDRPRRPKPRRSYAREKNAWGVSERGGHRVRLRTLIEDGQYPGLLVARDEYEPKHPQEFPLSGHDATNLRRPSLDSSYSDTVVQLPAAHKDGDPAVIDYFVPMTVTLGRMTADSLAHETDELDGLRLSVALGLLIPEVSTAQVDAFLTGLEPGVQLGSMTAVGVADEEASLSGVQAGVAIGTVTAVVDTPTAELTGIQSGVALGTLMPIVAVYVPSTFRLQFNGPSPVLEEHKS